MILSYKKLYVKDLLVLNFDKVKLNKPFSLFYTWIKNSVNIYVSDYRNVVVK